MEKFAPAFAADHAVGERVIELEGRADREGKLSDSHRVAVGQLHDRQIFRLDLDHRDIGLFIRADDLCPKFERPSFSFTSILSAPSTTWKLVKM